MLSATAGADYLKPYTLNSYDLGRPLTQPWLGAEKAPKPIADAVARHAERVASFRAAAAAHHDHISDANRHKAGAADRAALKDAAIAGKGDPGEVALSAWENKARSLYRMVVGNADVLAEAFEALEAAVREHGEAWLADADDQHNQKRSAFLAALTELDDAITELDKTGTAADYIASLVTYCRSSPNERGYGMPGGVWPSPNPPRRIPLSVDSFGDGSVRSLVHALSSYRDGE